MILTSIGGLLLCLVLSVVLEVLAAKAVRAVVLSASPLSGDHTDSFVYHRSLFTPGESSLAGAWAGLGVAGAAFWAAWTFNESWGYALAAVAWTAALSWDLWTWERVAASVKYVTWRRGWNQTSRRVSVSQVAEVHAVEKSVFGPLRACYVALTLHGGKAVKLPRTGTIGGLAAVEDLANFVRIQVQQVADVRARIDNERRRAGKGPVDPVDRELRQKLSELRRRHAVKAHQTH
jgi:hypothetical protein